MAWAQSIPVSNEAGLRAALSNTSVVYISLNASFNITGTDELVVSSTKVIDLVSYELTCQGTHIRVASGVTHSSKKSGSQRRLPDFFSMEIYGVS